MSFLEILFWISLCLVFYTYIGYGILIYLIVKIRECFRKPALLRIPSDEALPPLTLFITAYNEEEVVDKKMRNTLSLDYPSDKLTILWVTDGSNDHTNERLAAWTEATVLFQPKRQGKTAAMNRGMKAVKTPIVVFTDANTTLNKDALREIARAFTNQYVGCVAGEKRIAVHDTDHAAAGGEGLYWKYESALKSLDDRMTSAVGAAGELFAIRRHLYKRMPTDTLLDDFVLSLRIVMQGFKIAYCPYAYAVEGGSADMHEEQKRKVRIAAGGLQAIWRLRPLLNPFRYGMFSFQYISHRVLRWSITPILLFLLLPLNIALLVTHTHTMLYAVILLLQILFYLAGIRGYLLSQKNIKNKWLFVPYYFLFMNVNVIKGMVYLSRRKDHSNGSWEKSQRRSE